jgi:PEGA domain-containing protein
MRHATVFLVVVGLATTGCQQKAPPAKNVAPAVPVVAPAARPTPPAPSPRKTDTVAPPAPRAVSRAPVPAPAAAPAPAAPEAATLHIDSDVPGAQVFIDREYVGVTPVTAANVKAGSHRMNLSAQGYDGLAENVDIEPGPRDLMFKFKEVRLDASIDVVHKHRIGSCKGRLIAMPKGMRYDTTDKNDGFNVPLSALETFNVDYMAKTLHVRLAKGKNYDFTDPEGNADRLFVFHRDVDKVRQQLKGQ